VALSLRTSVGVYCSRYSQARPEKTKLDELIGVMRFTEQQRFGLPAVHIIDAQADSVMHYRQWNEVPNCFYLVRAVDRYVQYQDVEHKCSKVQSILQETGRFKQVREVSYKGKAAIQSVAQAPVQLTRAGQRNRNHSKDRHRVPGPPVDLRLVISEVRSSMGELLATWCLLTNVPAEVEPERIALWYYWRWKTEEFFKLLKSAGMHVEHWQQESPAALARRLLVACMACAVVWQLARSTHPQADAARQLLIKLSGRLMKRKTPFTLPALLAGTWILLAMLETLNHYSLKQLQQLAHVVIQKPP
jgi:hypothetical protein